MPKRFANAQWNGNFKDGSGSMNFGDFEGPFSAASRFEEGDGTNPEELIGAAHAGCFSMAFSLALGAEGFDPNSIDTDAEVTIEKRGEDFVISTVRLETEGDVPGIDEETFQSIAVAAKDGCPVSNALTGVDIELEATLK